MTGDTGAGLDTITNHGFNVSISGGADDDFILTASVYSRGTNAADVTINGGAGNDLISLSSNEQHHWIEYTVGDGDDTILGYNSNTTINISGAAYASEYSGDDIVFTVGDGSIMLKDARDKPLPIIIGESGTSGGGSDSGGNGGGSSSGSGRSAVGSRGRSSSTSTDTDNGGSNVRVMTSSSRSGGSRIAVPNSTVDLMSNWTPSPQQPTAQTTATIQRVYAGGNQVIGDYQSGEKIVFGDVYTGSFYDGAGNYFIGSSTGALVIQNAADKVIDLSDAAGNSFIKAYSATTAGVIDGRGLAGFEIINGSAGSDVIFAGDGGSQLWGGLDVAADTMVGGGGADIFIGGRTQGADVILNASATDIVHLNDANLSDIMATEENNGTIAVAFNTGNVVAVQSSEALSAAFMLADGSAYRYNHANKSWQTA